MARALPGGGRMTLLNRELTKRARNGSSEVRSIASQEELLAVLDQTFGLIFPAGTTFPCAALDWTDEERPRLGN